MEQTLLEACNCFQEKWVTKAPWATLVFPSLALVSLVHLLVQEAAPHSIGIWDMGYDWDMGELKLEPLGFESQLSQFEFDQAVALDK